MTPTSEQLLHSAIQHHQSGRLPQAEALYRKILRQDPDNADALNLMGVAAYQAGRHARAVELTRRAVAVQPGFPAPYINLGNALKALGRIHEAITAYRQGIVLGPERHDALNNLGNALKDDFQLVEAVASYRQAIAIKPDYPEAYNNLGAALMEQGRHEEALAAFRMAITQRPNYPEAHSNLGHALHELGRPDEAVAACRQAIDLRPGYPEAYSNLGNAFRKQGRLDEAVNAHRKAIALKPNLAEAHNNLGNSLRDMGRLDEAVSAYRQALKIRPNQPQTYCNLATALKEQRCSDSAVAAYRKAIEINPNLPEIHCGLGNALKDMGRLDAAIAAYRQAITLNPDYVDAHNNLIYSGYYHYGSDARAIAGELHDWNLHHAEPLKGHIKSHPNDRDPMRRLRIGYVSPDFRDHSLGRNILPLLREHDHSRFEIICYANNRRPDDFTARFRSCADDWRSIAGISDERAEEMVRADRIDILVDLTLHMADNRLQMFARQPAPVQVSFAGYPGTTGMDAIHYNLTDPYLDPPTLDEEFRVGHPFRLPASFWCYDHEGMGTADAPDPGPPPVRDTGSITFGCLNNYCKVNDQVLGLWARVMMEVAGSRLLLLAPAGSHRQHALDLLREWGVAPERVEFAANCPRAAYLGLYQRIDISLDPFPCNGHTTSLDSLWMGVPVVTLVGSMPVGRGGWSQLNNLGLAELAATTEEDYVRIASGLAVDLPRLAELRSGLRGRMRTSPLMDASGFARGVEAAYREMWQKWCASDAP